MSYDVFCYFLLHLYPISLYYPSCFLLFPGTNTIEHPHYFRLFVNGSVFGAFFRALPPPLDVDSGASDCIASHRIASQRIASYRIVSRRVASHRVASNRIVSHRVASHRIASYCFVLHRIALHYIVGCY